MGGLCDQTATEQKRLLDRRDVSAVELLDAHLERIDAANPVINAVVALDRDVARRSADRIDDARAAGEPVGPLAGLVTAHKDLTDTVDFPTTYGCPVFADHVPVADSLLVSRMKAAGAVAVGKTNVPEFGTGSHTFNPIYGTTVNPWDTARSAGGSSGGAAAALAAGMVSIADGSDFGGSLRNPAAWNNVVGFRSSPGLVPMIGRGVARSSFPISGAMGRTVDDLALLLNVIGAPDQRDPLNRGQQIPAAIPSIDRPLRVAFSPTVGGLPVEPDVAAVLDMFVSQIPSLRWSVEVAEPDLRGADECFETIRSFLYANGPVGDFSDEDFARTKPTIQEEVQRGRALGADEVAKAYVVLNDLWQRGVAFFENFDLLVAPVTQVSPFPADQEYPTEVNGVACTRYLDWMRSVCRITVLGLPALSLPAGFTEAGMPVGAQLIGGPQSDLQLLSAAKALETLTGHWQRRPPALP